MKVMKNNFYFISKALFVVNFCLDFLVMQQNSLIRKIILISNFMTSQPGQQTTVIHILPNISSSRGNQIIEYNIRNIFLEKSYAEWGGETSPRHFSGKLKLSISLDQQSKILCSLLKQDILKLSCRLLVITSYLAFFNKKRSGTSLPARFFVQF